MLIMFFSISAFSVSNIKDTKHNLAYSKGGSIGSIENDELCVYCHTPNGAISNFSTQPLWNKAINSKAFSIYSATNIELSDDSTPANSSMACLSCHDGINAINVLANIPGLNPAEIDSSALNAGAARLKIGEDKNHPVSVVYTSGVAGLKAISSALVGWAGVTNIDDLLRNNKVECGSCHDPHEATNGTFLRVSNAKGDLCTGCHIK